MSLDAADAGLLAEAVDLRRSGDAEAARQILLALHQRHGDDPIVNLQTAWAHDKLGLEAEAVPFYERAIEGGLERGDLENALLGLGSTYRTLGRYEESLRTLDRGVETYPDNAAMKVFRAMALYNNDRAKEACQSLLTVIAATPGSDELAAYGPAIHEYSLDLDRVWT